MKWIDAAYDRDELSVEVYSGQWLYEFQIVTTEPLYAKRIESYPLNVSLPYYFVDLDDMIRAHKRMDVPVLVYSFKTDAVQVQDGYKRNIFSIDRGKMSQAMKEYLAAGGLASMDRHVLDNMGIKYEVDVQATMIRLPAEQLIIGEQIKEKTLWARMRARG